MWYSLLMAPFQFMLFEYAYNSIIRCLAAALKYRQTSYIHRTFVCNKIVGHSDEAGASPVGAAPTTSSFSTEYRDSMDWAKTVASRDEKHFSVGILCGIY